MNQEEYEKNLQVLKKRKWRELPLSLLLLGVGLFVVLGTGKFGAFVVLAFGGLAMGHLASKLASKAYEKWIESDEEKEAKAKLFNAAMKGELPEQKDNK